MNVLQLFFFFNDTATPEIYTLSLHDALPIWSAAGSMGGGDLAWIFSASMAGSSWSCCCRSEEHTSELQSRENLVCRLLLEKKKKKINCLFVFKKKKKKKKSKK